MRIKLFLNDFYIVIIINLNFFQINLYVLWGKLVWYYSFVFVSGAFDMSEKELLIWKISDKEQQLGILEQENKVWSSASHININCNHNLNAY